MHSIAVGGYICSMTSFTLEDINIRTVLMPGDIGYVTYMHGRWLLTHLASP